MEISNKCQLCNSMKAKYICPRCNIPYCSVECYQSQLHVQCSESFYKDCVVEQIKSANADPQSQSKMMEILQRVQHIDEQFENYEVQDSDDEDGEEELAARLNGVDLDDADLVWERLTTEERIQFEELLRSGDVSEVVPSWQPWWLYKESTKLVEDIHTLEQNPEYPSYIPKVKENVKPLSVLSKVSPSSCVRWNVVNVLTAYSVTSRVYNGEYIDAPLEAVTTLVSLSGNLSKNLNFEELDSAVAAVHLASISNPCIMIGIDEVQMKKDVQNIIEGPSKSKHNIYVLAALSDIYDLFSISKEKIKENVKSKEKGEFYKKFPEAKQTLQNLITMSEVKTLMKKIDFYLSWAIEYY